MTRTICTVVPFPTTDEQAMSVLLPPERLMTRRMAPLRLRAFAAGRFALRAAAAQLGQELGAVLATARGAPLLPPSLVGSVSHSDGRAVALLSAAGDGQLGVDLEADRKLEVDIAGRVLSPVEVPEVAPLPPEERAFHVLVRFSLKEAIAKALDPLVGRVLRLRELALDVRPDGTASVTAAPPCAAGLRVAASWRRLDGMILSAARARCGPWPEHRGPCPRFEVVLSTFEERS